MRVLLFLLTLIAFAMGGAVFADAKSAIHEIEGFLLFLIGAVFLSAAAVVEALVMMRREINRLPSRFAATETYQVRNAST